MGCPNFYQYNEGKVFSLEVRFFLMWVKLVLNYKPWGQSVFDCINHGGSQYLSVCMYLMMID